MTGELREQDNSQLQSRMAATMRSSRFGVYYTPDPDSVISRIWSNWLINSGDLKAFTSQPRMYGFHATLKPPFRLKPEYRYVDLREAVRELAGKLEPLLIPPMQVVWLDSFLALRPVDACPAAHQIAETCVRSLDWLRAPLTESERQKRLSHRLSDREGMLLERWGYPFVLEQFRFHFTLSNELAANDHQTRQKMYRLATELHAQTQHAWPSFDALSVVEQAYPGAQFSVRERIQLSIKQPRQWVDGPILI
jgi:Protein of unknown function (DUF1045)